MSFTAQQVFACVACLVVGWFGHVGFDALTDWWYDVTGAAASLMWDLMAILGIVTVIAAVAGGFWLAHK